MAVFWLSIWSAKAGQRPAILKDTSDPAEHLRQLEFERAGKRNSNNKVFQFWQQDNHPIELSNPGMLKQKMDYLHENPVRAGIVFEPQHYVYSSAVDYCTNQKGSIVIEHLKC